MTKKLEFLNNAQFFTGGNTILSAENYEKYKAEMGAEKAQAYVQGIYDMSKTLDVIVNSRSGTISPHMVKKMVSDLYYNNMDFLHNLIEKGEFKLDEKPAAP